MTKVFVALDTSSLEETLGFAKAFAGLPLGLKLGLTFFAAQGSAGVRAVQAAAPNVPIFLDLKLHDIPAQVEGAVKSVASLGVQYLTLHGAGGSEMLHYARRAVDASGTSLKLLAVTVLTSMNDAQLQETGVVSTAAAQVERLGRLAITAGTHGLICSPLEIEALRAGLGSNIVLMVPGIRPAESNVKGDDQKRVLTPQQAIQKGATHLVIGRPITGASDPAQAAQQILASL